MQIKGAGRRRQKARAITVHAKSQITAAEWVKKIKSSDHVPQHFQDPLRARRNRILLTNPLKFRIPSDVLPRDWTTDWLSVFVADGNPDNKDWEMSTGCLDIKVRKAIKTKDRITVVHNPDLSQGESVSGFTKFTMTAKARDVSELAFEKGNTLPTGVKLKSKRKFIAIANRVALDLDGKTEKLKFTDDELVETWFHELAAHAGRNAQGLIDTHGDNTVDGHAREIRDMFPKTTTIRKVGEAIKKHLKE